MHIKKLLTCIKCLVDLQSSLDSNIIGFVLCLLRYILSKHCYVNVFCDLEECQQMRPLVLDKIKELEK